MKRRNFLKNILGGIAIGPSAFNAMILDTKRKDKFVRQWNKKNSEVYLGILYNGIEITSKDYHRIKTPKNWELLPNGVLINAEEIQFPTCENSWGNINEFAFYDTEKDGNMLISGRLAKQIYISSGDTITFLKQYIEIIL